MHRLVLLSVCFINPMLGRYSTNWDWKGWPGLEIQIYCLWQTVRYFGILDKYFHYLCILICLIFRNPHLILLWFEGMQIGGLSGLCPERKSDFAQVKWFILWFFYNILKIIFVTGGVSSHDSRLLGVFFKCVYCWCFIVVNK